MSFESEIEVIFKRIEEIGRVRGYEDECNFRIQRIGGIRWL